ncbi:histone acetyltransferase type B catalytic subunit isoform X1 [Cucurbita pepo subsp. pepo]|uniref:histone acetyltransferase type B catalytic subunit isoform X1 n=1 Tax=Cucurbita pepo subsp. pepo TaxID=3664 RepID=UPI000C9D2DD3|nr:histone acetyltransferase type B catalytic subunit isoform X1 [Cucurbita pepo subsp. pepo]
MGQKHQPSADPRPDTKKKRRVAFSNIDTGIPAKDCIKIYLVSTKEEVGSTDSLCIDPVDLNSFFEDEDGKIYGYQGLKITVWFSIVSFHAYADIVFESTSDGGKGITDLKSTLQNIFAETLVDNKDNFLQTFSKDANFIGSVVADGEVLHPKASSNGQFNEAKFHVQAANSDLEVIRLPMDKMAGRNLYSRLVPLALLLIDGSSPIDVTDPRWELYVLSQKNNGRTHPRLLGFAALYRFYHYPDSSRLRLSQILILPPYQCKGFGRFLLEVLNNVAISENVHDFTIEEPISKLQQLRTCIDVKRLQGFSPIEEAVSSAISQFKLGKLSKKISFPPLLPSPEAIEAVRKSLKITKEQFSHCWEILIYLGIEHDKHLEDFILAVSSRMRDDLIGETTDAEGKQVVDVPTDYDQEMSFVMFRSTNNATGVEMDESRGNQEEQLKKLVDDRVKEIKLIAQKVSSDQIRSISKPS